MSGILIRCTELSGDVWNSSFDASDKKIVETVRSKIGKKRTSARLDSSSRQLLRDYTVDSPNTSPLRADPNAARRSFEELGPGIGLGVSDPLTVFPSQARRGERGNYSTRGAMESTLEGSSNRIVGSSLSGYAMGVAMTHGLRPLERDTTMDDAYSPTDMQGRFPREEQRQDSHRAFSYLDQSSPQAPHHPLPSTSSRHNTSRRRSHRPTHFTQQINPAVLHFQPNDKGAESLITRLSNVLLDNNRAVSPVWTKRLENLLDEAENPPTPFVPAARVNPLPRDYPNFPARSHPPYRGRHVFIYEMGDEKANEDRRRLANKELRDQKKLLKVQTEARSGAS